MMFHRPIVERPRGARLESSSRAGFARYFPGVAGMARRALASRDTIHSLLGAVFLFLFLAPHAASAQTTVLHLKNGDRVAGNIVSEDTNHVVITTSWIKELAVPLAQIARREIVPPQAGATNGVAASNAPVALGRAAATVAAAPPKPPAKHWKGEARLGADFLYGPNEQQIYYGRFKLTYEHPYEANPKQFFRNFWDFSADYGWTENPQATNANKSVLSANRMYGSDKTDLDIWKQKWYVYDLAGGGYDEIRKIDAQYEVGPGLGYHLLTQTNFLMNVESGADYQAQYRSDQTTTKDVFFRVAEDVTWRINHSLKLTEKFEIFPRADAPECRARTESTLSYALWHNLSLNLSLLDLYDTLPAAGVPNNDLQIHSSVGVTF